MTQEELLRLIHTQVKLWAIEEAAANDTGDAIERYERSMLDIASLLKEIPYNTEEAHAEISNLCEL